MISRRKCLGYGVAVAGTAAQALFMNRLANADNGSNTISLNQGLWTYHRIDPARAEKTAYELHAKVTCSYGVFAGVLEQLIERYGEPYRSFPLRMMEFAARGIGGYGICGGLVGGTAAIGLFCEGKTRGELITSLLQWYEKTELPVYRPPQSLASAEEIPSVAAQSVLCQNSISAWCQKSGLKLDSKERRERCFRLSADVCRKTAELLNAAVNA